MSDCPLCDREHGELLLYEDGEIIALQHPAPATAGHIIIIPRQHITIFEQVDNKTIGKAFALANRMSSILFESLPIQGTNILVQNGLAAGQEQPHFMIHVIPRTEKDNLNLQWQPKETSEDELATAEAKMKALVQNVGVEKKTEKKVVHTQKTEEITEGEDDYRLRQLRRLP